MKEFIEFKDLTERERVVVVGINKLIKKLKLDSSKDYGVIDAIVMIKLENRVDLSNEELMNIEKHFNVGWTPTKEKIMYQCTSYYVKDGIDKGINSTTSLMTLEEAQEYYPYFMYSQLKELASLTIVNAQHTTEGKMYHYFRHLLFPDNDKRVPEIICCIYNTETKEEFGVKQN